tara:strand:- start:672 stop:1058 length:387 start_codon:yes stop_codon:yes gene_type:complete
MPDTDLSRRLARLELNIDTLPKIEAKQHAHANTLQIHSGQLDAIIGPKDSLLLQVGKMKGSIGLIEERLKNIDGGLSGIQEDVGKLVASADLARADTEGQWQLRATLATALIAAGSAVAIASMQYLAP